jgi:serine/threonine-protein kinase
LDAKSACNGLAAYPSETTLMIERSIIMRYPLVPTTALLTAALVLGSAASGITRPSASISTIEFFSYVDLGPGYQYLSGRFVVPDQDTSRRISGDLRAYDIHIAKLFEVTDYQCRTWNNSPIPYRGERGIVWSYFADGGDAWMGIFTIDCDEARSVMSQFTQGGTESTTMFFFEARHTLNIPTLALTTSPQEINAWMDFVQQVPPQQSP